MSLLLLALATIHYDMTTAAATSSPVSLPISLFPSLLVPMKSPTECQCRSGVVPLLAFSRHNRPIIEQVQTAVFSAKSISVFLFRYLLDCDLTLNLLRNGADDCEHSTTAIATLVCHQLHRRRQEAYQEVMRQVERKRCCCFVTVRLPAKFSMDCSVVVVRQRRLLLLHYHWHCFRARLSRRQVR